MLQNMVIKSIKASEGPNVAQLISLSTRTLELHDYFSLLCPIIEGSLHTCGFVVTSWDSCENYNVKRNHTQPKKIDCILVGTEKSELKALIIAGI